jgi:hypothetical protein
MIITKMYNIKKIDLSRAHQKIYKAIYFLGGTGGLPLEPR